MAFTARTETYAYATSADERVISVPGSTADDDILFLWIGARNTSGYVVNSIDASWTLLGSDTSNSDKYWLYYKIASSEPADYTIGFSGAGKVRLVMSCYTSGDYDTADPIDQTSNTSYRTDNTTMRAAGVTVTSSSSVGVFWGGLYGPSTTQTAPSDIGSASWTEDDDTGESDSDYYLAIYSITGVASGATGDMDSTMSGAHDLKHAFAVFLNPTGGGAGISIPVAMHHYKQQER